MIPLKHSQAACSDLQKEPLTYTPSPANLVCMLGYRDCGWSSSLAGWQAQHSNAQGRTGCAVSYVAAAQGGPSRAESSLWFSPLRLRLSALLLHLHACLLHLTMLLLDGFAL